MREPLPIDLLLPDIVDAVRRTRSAVVVAPPGSGKTTRVPPALLDAGLAGDGRVLVLQPRRVAARLAAARIAAERGGRVGGEVGYRVRLEDRTGPDTRIEVLTEGLLTRRLLSDPFLDGVGAVILDEFHERSQHADFALSLVAEVRREARPDLAVVVMSATLEAEPIATFVGGEGGPAPVIRGEGGMFPVEMRYDRRADGRWRGGSAWGGGVPPSHERLEDRVAAAVREGLPEQGTVLVFLPGAGEIERVFESLADVDADLVRLHGRMPLSEQERALAPARSGRPKVVLATNVAETSVTVPGVVAVVDSGLARVARFDPALGVERLETEPCSRASADQRAGRAGRTAPGRCRRLWTEATHRDRPVATTPEIRTADLAEVVLHVRSWGADPRTFCWFERPPDASLAQAESLLRMLGALDDGGLTPMGRTIAGLPVHPRLGRVIVEGRARGCLREACAAAALATERDPWADARVLGDLDDRIGWLESSAGTGADRRALEEVRRSRDHLLAVARRMDGEPRSLTLESRREAVLRALLAGFPDRVAVRTGGRRFRLAGGGAGVLSEGVDVGDAEIVLVVSATAAPRGERATHRIYLAVPVERAWLPLMRTSELAWDSGCEAVVSSEIESSGGLVLASRPSSSAPDPTRIAAILLESARATPERALAPSPDALRLLARIGFLARARPDLGLPAWGGFADLLPDLVPGRSSFADLRSVDLAGWMRGRLAPMQREALDRLAPERWPLPCGAAARVRYGRPDEPPVVSARVQQWFGVRETPRIAGVRARVELLSPALRPVQVTTDLASFWTTTYAEVRRELRGRYPRHSWPEDPRTPIPPRKGR